MEENYELRTSTQPRIGYKREFIPLALWSDLKPRIYETAGLVIEPKNILILSEKGVKDAPLINDRNYVVDEIQKNTQDSSTKVATASISKVNGILTEKEEGVYDRLREKKLERIGRYSEEGDHELANYARKRLNREDVLVSMLESSRTDTLYLALGNQGVLRKMDKLGLESRQVTLIAGQYQDNDSYAHLHPLRWETGREPKGNQDLTKEINTLITALSPLVKCEYALLRKARLELTEIDSRLEQQVIDTKVANPTILGIGFDPVYIQGHRESFANLPLEKREKVLALARAWHGPQSGDDYKPEIYLEELLTFAVHDSRIVETSEIEVVMGEVKEKVSQMNSGSDAESVSSWLKRLQQRLPQAFSNDRFGFLKLPSGK